MPEPTLEAVVEEARGLLRGKTITGTSPRDDSLVEVALDPACDKLRALFEETCKHKVWWATKHQKDGGHRICFACKHDVDKGDFVVSRLPYWLDEPNGALEGALWKALGPFDNRDPIFTSLLSLLENDGDTKLAAVQALCEWLKKKKP